MLTNAPDRPPKEEARGAFLQKSRAEPRKETMGGNAGPESKNMTQNWTGTGRGLVCSRCGAEIGRFGRILRTFGLPSHLCPM
jgi:hypothetical protein